MLSVYCGIEQFYKSPLHPTKLQGTWEDNLAINDLLPCSTCGTCEKGTVITFSLLGIDNAHVIHVM